MYLVKPTSDKDIKLNGQLIPAKGIEVTDVARVQFIRHAQRGDITLEKVVIETASKPKVKGATE